ncbi:MAG: alpha/beta fold hydrolase [Myxacorys chilensis ATA2-1-KO14]|jgi:pimeloyl-ACP methyl ester carboxylesterase|nr:alpha/beta fold hydrolase [Myxacorys chilensis ATA2-1-KO14]
MFSTQDQFVKKQVSIRNMAGSGKFQMGSPSEVHTITYLEAGTNHGATPIVFLHGWAIAAKPYREILDLLSQRHRVIMPDLPGFGDSRDCGLLESNDRYAINPAT